jgi:hypothetical protein
VFEKQRSASLSPDDEKSTATGRPGVKQMQPLSGTTGRVVEISHENETYSEAELVLVGCVPVYLI